MSDHLWAGSPLGRRDAGSSTRAAGELFIISFYNIKKSVFYLYLETVRIEHESLNKINAQLHL